MTRTKGKK